MKLEMAGKRYSLRYPNLKLKKFKKKVSYKGELGGNVY